MSFLSSVLGLDASHNAGVAQGQSAAFQAKAAPLYDSVASQGTTVANQGASLTNMFNQQFPSLMSMFEGAAGLPNTVSGQQAGQGGQPGQTGTTGNTAQGGGKAPTPNQPNAGVALASNLHPSLSAYAAANPTFNPYQLNPDGQAYLGAQLQAMDQNTQSAISSYNNNLAQMGISDSSSSAAGATWIKQQADAAKNTFVSNFMLQQQQEQMQAAQSLLSTITQVGATGAQEQVQGANLTGQAASGYAGLSGANQQTALQEQQLANTQQAGLASFLGQFIPKPAAAGASTSATSSDYGGTGSIF